MVFISDADVERGFEAHCEILDEFMLQMRTDTFDLEADFKRGHDIADQIVNEYMMKVAEKMLACCVRDDIIKDITGISENDLVHLKRKRLK